MHRNILVIGGAGFIVSYSCMALIDLHLAQPEWRTALLRHFNYAGHHKSSRSGEQQDVKFDYPTLQILGA